MAQALQEATPPGHEDAHAVQLCLKKTAFVLEYMHSHLVGEESASRVLRFLGRVAGLPREVRDDAPSDQWITEGPATVAWDGKKDEKLFVYLFRTRIVFVSGPLQQQQFVASWPLGKTLLERGKKNGTLLLTYNKKQAVVAPIEADVNNWYDMLAHYMAQSHGDAVKSEHFFLSESKPFIPPACTLGSFFQALTAQRCPEKEFNEAKTAFLLYRPLLFPVSQILIELERAVREADVFGKIRMASFTFEWICDFFERDFRNTPNVDFLQESLILTNVFTADEWGPKIETEFHSKLRADPRAEEKCNYDRLAEILAFARPHGALPKTFVRDSFSLVNDVSCKMVAQQLALIESKVFAQIKLSELQRQTWNKMPDWAPNVRQMIGHFNRFSTWMAFCIVQEKDAKGRAHVMKYMINVGHHSLELGNFNAAMQVVAALASSPVRRLRNTFKNLSSKTQARLEDMRTTLGSALNFSAYRTRLANQKPPCVPYLGIMLQDLVFQDENADFIEDKMNFDKISRSHAILLPLRRFQGVEYPFRPVPEIQQYLVQCRSLADEGSMFQMSLINEPRLEN